MCIMYERNHINLAYIMFTIMLARLCICLSTINWDFQKNTKKTAPVSTGKLENEHCNPIEKNN